MLNLKKAYKIHSKKEAAYIPILDKDSMYAAHALTKEDLKLSYELLKECFQEIETGEIVHTVLVDTIMDSKENFLWYTAFLKEMEKILKIKDIVKIPYDKQPYKKSRTKQPTFQLPFVNKGSYIRYWKNLTSSMDPINLYRTQYIIAQYDMDEFQDENFPAWYLMQNTVIYEQYNERTNVRVRISCINGELQYYIAGASDNWQQIKDVPIQMDSVVSALIFKNYTSLDN